MDIAKRAVKTVIKEDENSSMVYIDANSGNKA